MISNLIDRKARIPHGAAKAIAATIRPGEELIVQPNYINSVKTAARNIGVKITTRKVYKGHGWAYLVKLVDSKTETVS